jgi:hypothetical protein
MFTTAQNVYDQSVDTALYQLPATPVEGINKFNRLILDLGAGVEFPLGGNFYLYGEARTWIPTSDYPSPLLHNNRNVPLPAMLSLGLRICFETPDY